MNNKVLKVSNLSKQYRLGVISHHYLFRDIQSWWNRIRKKEDPNSKINLNLELKSSVLLNNISEENNAKVIDDLSVNSAQNCIWALKDVSFEVNQGERIGIIGRNGAGKSTLLKILSRVTTPTKGTIKGFGRVASLLEVGTGFHPELTGRENVFLNGAILGMSKSEILRKFDEIIEFSGVEKFIDTPVKRYSSGMYVRLAFAVAAYLDPDILVVDEVLAVGDSEFQKKCLGKMKDVAEGGRTVLFVSHNMGAIQSLCSRAILLHNGEMLLDGTPSKVVSQYLTMGFKSEGERYWPDLHNAPGDNYVRIKSVRVLDENGNVCTNFDVRDQIIIEICYWVLYEMESVNRSFCFFNHRGEIIFHSRNDSMDLAPEKRKCLPGLYLSKCHIPCDFMNDGQIFVQVAVTDELIVHFQQKDMISFNIRDDMDPNGVRRNYIHEWPPAAVRPRLFWTNERYPLTNQPKDKERDERIL